MKTSSWIVVSVALVLLSACAGFRLQPVAPARPIVVAGFEIVYGNEIPGDRRRLLDRLGVPLEMQRALRASYPVGPGPVVRVTITQFRSGRWGPTRMHTVTQVLDATGRILGQIETDSTSVVGGNRNHLIRNVAQDTVNQVAARL